MAKNIVLLSDGTGNSASSPFKTNVWRIYQALDISAPAPSQIEQVVFYDNGVGTETFKPLALLGLALGIGLAKNVKDLYTFLCRNYRPGDNIYLFGFSRGAFTVRILAGFVLRCGLVTAPSEDELGQRVKLAYAEYKRDVARRATATRPWLIAGHLLGGWRKGRKTDRVSFKFPPQEGVPPQYFPNIAFIGVWDTVDAYGMPIDELKEGIDRYIWPMTLADRGLSDHVDRACHALCLDDERPTFRPVLWSDPTIDPDRLTQVWFPGVHANVGGGYPDDGLAYVTLQWMMDEAVRSGLRFYPQLRAEYGDRVDVQGEQYDSRSGLGGYYRYGPRDVDSLCADAEHDVSVAHPLIHDSALQRIQRWQVAYASVSFPSLPRGYIRLVRQVAGSTAAALPPPPALAPAPPIETPDQIRDRAKDMEDFVADAVFRRRAAYLVTVAFTALLAMLPVFDWIAKIGFWGTVSTKLGDSLPGLNRLLSAPFLGLAWLGEELSRIPGWSWGTKALGDALTWTVDQGFFPAWVSFWLKSYAGHPALFLFCGLVVLWLFFRKSEQLQEQVFARTEYAWRRI